MKDISQTPGPTNEIADLCDRTMKVEIIETPTNNEPDVWQIHIHNEKKEVKILELTTKQLAAPTAFKQQYLKAFRRCAPTKLKNGDNDNTWNVYVDALGAMGEVVEGEEDLTEFVANEFLARLSQFEIVETPNETITLRNVLLVRDKYVVCLTQTATDIIDHISKRVDPTTVGKFLVSRKMKLPSRSKEATTITVGGVPQRFWYILQTAIAGNQEDEQTDVIK